MRRALIARYSAVCLAVALSVGRVAGASEPKAIVRVVLAAPGDPPAWFDGFVRHLRSELALRGIDVVAGGPGPASEAELVVEILSVQRPLLRFMAPGRESFRETGAPERTISLGGVPADGRALALAVAADELMRSNWSRARPRAASGETSEAGDASAGQGSVPVANEAKPSNEAKPVDGRVASTMRLDPDDSDTAFRPRTTSRSPAVIVQVAAAMEIFTGGQTEVGPDVRFAVYVAPNLQLELRGGFRSVMARDAPSGSVGGTALVGGGAAHWIAERYSGAAVGVTGRADMLRVSYSGNPRDGAVTGSDGAVLGVVLAAGGWARWELAKSVWADGELLAGGSPKSATATADFAPTMSTRGFAVLASAGLSVGF